MLKSLGLVPLGKESDHSLLYPRMITFVGLIFRHVLVHGMGFDSVGIFQFHAR